MIGVNGFENTVIVEGEWAQHLGQCGACDDFLENTFLIFGIGAHDFNA